MEYYVSDILTITKWKFGKIFVLSTEYHNQASTTHLFEFSVYNNSLVLQPTWFEEEGKEGVSSSLCVSDRPSFRIIVQVGLRFWWKIFRDGFIISVLEEGRGEFRIL